MCAKVFSKWDMYRFAMSGAAGMPIASPAHQILGEIATEVDNDPNSDGNGSTAEFVTKLAAWSDNFLCFKHNNKYFYQKELAGLGLGLGLVCERAKRASRNFYSMVKLRVRKSLW